MIKSTLLFIFSAILFACSIWCLMWVFSSSSLASEYCGNKFTLFHEEFRCRQPNIAFILFVVFSILSIVSVILGVKNARHRRRT